MAQLRVFGFLNANCYLDRNQVDNDVRGRVRSKRRWRDDIVRAGLTVPQTIPLVVQWVSHRFMILHTYGAKKKRRLLKRRLGKKTKSELLNESCKLYCTWCSFNSSVPDDVFSVESPLAHVATSGHTFLQAPVQTTRKRWNRGWCPLKESFQPYPYFGRSNLWDVSHTIG